MYIFQIHLFKKNNKNTLSCQICVPPADGSYMLQLVPLVLSLYPHSYSSCTQGNNKAIRQSSTYLWSIKNNNIALYRVLFNPLKGECHPSYQGH